MKPYSVVKIYRYLGEKLRPSSGSCQLEAKAERKYLAGCLFLILFDPEDGGNRFLRKVGKLLLPDYMSHPVITVVKTSNLAIFLSSRNLQYPNYPFIYQFFTFLDLFFTLVLYFSILLHYCYPFIKVLHFLQL
jgi:hypothetical protein